MSVTWLDATSFDKPKFKELLGRSIFFQRDEPNISSKTSNIYAALTSSLCDATNSGLMFGVAGRSGIRVCVPSLGHGCSLRILCIYERQ